MKKETVLILLAAVAGVGAVAYLTRKKAPTASAQAGTRSASAGVSKVNNTALPGEQGWGWTYYTDGTSIDPAGNYYVAGNLVYSASSGGEPVTRVVLNNMLGDE